LNDLLANPFGSARLGQASKDPAFSRGANDIGTSRLHIVRVCEAQWSAEKYNLQKLISAQNHYNLLYRYIEKRMEPFCVKYGIGMNSYFPLAGDC
jgi:aryl-alcohol dehydrogenase-like predicted oxidoreductase